jgi:hypothetical protein
MNKISISALAALASVACQAQFSELWHQTYDDPSQHSNDGAQRNDRGKALLKKEGLPSGTLRRALWRT